MKTEAKNKIKELVQLGNPTKTYSTFQEQLMDDTNFKTLSAFYGKFTELRKPIEEELTKFFSTWGKEYVNVAIAQIKVMAIPLDIKYHETITMEADNETI